jgi:hypothetical protein
VDLASAKITKWELLDGLQPIVSAKLNSASLKHY